jgi:hypothetical protein
LAVNGVVPVDETTSPVKSSVVPLGKAIVEAETEPPGASVAECATATVTIPKVSDARTCLNMIRTLQRFVNGYTPTLILI